MTQGGEPHHIHIRDKNVFERLEADRFADHISGVRAGATFILTSDWSNDKDVEMGVCLKYANTNLAGIVAGGYHSVGRLLLKVPKIEKLLVRYMHMYTCVCVYVSV